MDELNFNKNPLRLPSEKTKGIAGTLIVHSAVFLLLIFVGFSLPVPGDDKGILVNFGTDETGSGQIEPSPSFSYEDVAVPNQVIPLAPKKTESILTQNYDKESPLIKKIDPEADKKKKEQIEAYKIKRAEIEAEKVKKAQEDAEREKIEQNQKRTTDIISRTKNAFTNGRNSGTNSTGEGITGGPGNQGDPNGSIDSKVRGKGSGTGNSGISYDLEGRNYQALPAPKYEYQGEGRVVVDINVDRNGNVIQANPGAKGSTTLDDYLLAQAKEAALKSKFETKPNAPAVQKGTITYNFILR